MKKLSLENQARTIDSRKATLGLGDEWVPVNQGKRRSAAKRALLRELRRLADEQNRPAPFRDR